MRRRIVVNCQKRSSRKSLSRRAAFPSLVGFRGLKKKKIDDFPGGPIVRNPLASAGDTGSISSLGRFLMLRGD